MSEQAIASDALGEAEEEWHLRLYVAGMTPTAKRALANIERICATHLANRYTLTVVDLLIDSHLAELDQILAVPTLVREQPLPVRKVIGDLSHTRHALRGLGIFTDAEQPVPEP